MQNFMCFNIIAVFTGFLINSRRRYSSATIFYYVRGQKWGFPIDFDSRPYYRAACDTNN